MDENGHAVVKDEDKLLEGKERTDDEVCIFIRDYCGMLQNAVRSVVWFNVVHAGNMNYCGMLQNAVTLVAWRTTVKHGT